MVTTYNNYYKKSLKSLLLDQFGPAFDVGGIITNYLWIFMLKIPGIVVAHNYNNLFLFVVGVANLKLKSYRN